MKKLSNKAKARNAPKYLTRNQAIKKLQVKLTQFRRLCILKGIHPREPRKKPKGGSKTYYHYKDIMFLAHEPLLKSFREITAHERRIIRAKAKLNADLARRLVKRTPTYRLDHLVKERYPSFVDALRDLDDALTLIHLFATLPADKRQNIPDTAVYVSRRLALEWQAYIVKTSSLRKVFIAVKGFYYQAEVLGQTITWLVPHQLSQVVPDDIDFKIMVTFSEFYQTLLQFVNFKLYHMIGFSYPPIVDTRLEEAAAGLSAIMQDFASPAAKENAAKLTAGAEDTLDPEAANRLEGLQDKLRKLQEESSAGMGLIEDAAGEAPSEIPEEAQEQQKSDSEDDQLDDIQSDASESQGGDEDAAEQDALPVSSDQEGRKESNAQAGPIVLSAANTGIVGGAKEGDDDAAVCAALFKGFVFFLGREVPREQLLVVIRAFGGQVGWEGEESPISETDESITHQVFDRPKLQKKLPNREYVQPQWVVDSANFRVLVDTRLYGPGTAPPPHLSPFVDNEEEGYMPHYASVLQKMQESAKAIRQQAEGIAADEQFLNGGDLTADPDASDLASAERQYTVEMSKELRVKRKAEAELAEEEDDLPGAKDAEVDAPIKDDKEKTARDEEAMNKALMSRKDRNLYQSILNRQSAQRDTVKKLQKKRARLSKGEA